MMDGEQITLLVKTFGGKDLTISVNPNETVETLKKKIKEQGEEDVENQKLTLKGKEMNDATKIADYKLNNKARLMLFKKKGNVSPVVQEKKEEKKVEVPAVRKLCEANCGFFG